MATFALYTYKFRHVDNIGVFAGQEQETTVALDTLEERQDFLQAIFRDDLNQQRKFNCFRTEERKNKDTGKKEKNSVGFDCKTLWEHNGFIILMVSNKKRITRHQRFQKFKDQDEPWCHVVIDNRYGQEFIAIEKNGAFTSPNIVAGILEDSLRARFTPHHVTIEIKNQYTPDAFWQVVDKHRSNGIKQVAFHFAAPNNPWAAELLGNMNEAAKGMQARPSAVFSSPDNEPIEINADNEELRKYVELCAKQGEDITVKVAGIRARIHILDVKDKFVLVVMDETLYRKMGENDPDLFEDEYPTLSAFFDNVLKPAANV